MVSFYSSPCFADERGELLCKYKKGTAMKSGNDIWKVIISIRLLQTSDDFYYITLLNYVYGPSSSSTIYASSSWSSPLYSLTSSFFYSVLVLVFRLFFLPFQYVLSDHVKSFRDSRYWIDFISMICQRDEIKLTWRWLLL